METTPIANIGQPPSMTRKTPTSAASPKTTPEAILTSAADA